MNDKKVDIGNRIREIRKGSGCSIRQLAEKVGISYLTMQRIETDKVSPSISLLFRIADSLNYPITSFFGEQKESVIFIKKEDQRVIKTMLMGLRLLMPRGIIGDNVTVSHGKTEKGRFVSRHKNEGFEFAYVLKGSCVVRHGKDKYEMHAGDVIFYDASEWHSVTALEPHEFLGIQFFSK
ncbi:MAG: cupin domain-containing protein [Syntrophorhabdales bacterium]|jgi:transcriptional regulator with XRE-family HTH domain